jgi:hypothetical protein
MVYFFSDQLRCWCPTRGGDGCSRTRDDSMLKHRDWFDRCHQDDHCNLDNNRHNDGKRNGDGNR